jgi:hypothetical protein
MPRLKWTGAAGPLEPVAEGQTRPRRVLRKRRLASINLVRGTSQWRAKSAAVACSLTPRGRFSSLMVSEAILVRDRGELANRRAALLLPVVSVVIGAVAPTKRSLSNFPAGPQTGSRRINLLLTLSRQDRAIGGCVP